MTFAQELEKTGKWLFRWRSYLPLTLLIPLLIEMRHFDWPMHSHRLQFIWESLCLAVSFTGLAVRAFTVAYVPKGTSGRNSSGQIADTLNTTGMYSVVRNPLYVGNFLMWLGIAMFCLNWRLLMIFVLAFFPYYERIMFAEEAFLHRKFGKQFEDWAARTPRFVPRFSKWQRPSLPFSWKTILQREYSGFLGMVVGFFALDTLADSLIEHQFVLEPFWTIFAIVSIVVYICLRTIKRRTYLLNVNGR